MGEIVAMRDVEVARFLKVTRLEEMAKMELNAWAGGERKWKLSGG